MRKAVVMLLVLALFAGVSGVSTVRAVQAITVEMTVGTTKAYVNSKVVVLDQPPVIENGTTLVPFRFIGEALGATIGWNPAMKTVSYVFGTTNITLTIGSTTATVNGATQTLLVAPKILPTGRTVVPVRFISEALGAKVNWNSTTRMVTITASATPPGEKVFILKMAGIKSDTDPASLAMQLFAKTVNENSRGTIVVKTYTNSVLGTINDLLTGMTNGTVDLLYNTLSCYSWLSSATKFNITSAPFFWTDTKQLLAFVNSPDVQQWIEDSATASGVRVLTANGELPPRELTANKPIKNADDFKDLKIRTAQSALVQAIMKKLGAIPIVIPLADLYMGLKTGVADAQENNFFTVKSSSFYEVQRYYMQDDYIRDVSAIFIGNKIWNQMSANQQKIMKDAANVATDYEAKTIVDTTAATMAFLATKMTKIDIDVASIRAKLGTDIYQQFDGTLWPAGTLAIALKFKNSYKP
jgi:TRAP-type C4-dicarboxylate transport system substrate-binding protein